jgi:aminoglycoside phosphotransferase (APT) family kinase protein
MSFARRIEVYLEDLYGADVRVENLERIHGGASRETYSFDAVAQGRRHGLVLRRDPAESLIDTDRRTEFLAYASFHPLGLPTPAPVRLEEGGAALERPFFIMTRVDGGVAASPFDVSPYAPHEDVLGPAFFSHLGAIAAADPLALPLAEVCPAPPLGGCWRQELERWEREIDKDELHPLPIARAAIRSLRRAPPPPAQKLSVVHGDYRSGNFLHDGEGRILAILDWEMAHFGDPLEDLAWALDPLWRHFDETKVAGLLPRGAAIVAWEAASGLTVDPAAFAWWELFASLKGLAIWVSAAKAYRDGGGRDPVLGFTGFYCARRHEAILAERLERRLDAA